MIDMFPFPRVTGETAEEQISSLVSYITQFKETLEFALMNISEDNLSPELMNRIKDLEANLQKIKEDREEEVAQLSIKVLNNTITEEGE